MSLQDQYNDVKGFADNLKGKIDKVLSKVDAFTTKFQDKIERFSEGLDSKIRLLKETMESESENVTIQFEKTNSFCKELIDLNK